MQRKETDAPPTDDYQDEERSGSTGSLPRGARNVLWMRLLKTSVFVLFLGGLVGAFYYAIDSQDENTEHGGKSHHLNHSLPYSAYRTQYSTSGKYVFEIMTPSYERLTFNGTTFWYQNEEKKELVYMMDNATVVWVFATRTFWATVNEKGETIKCKEDATVGYKEYIRQLSLTDMHNRHSEMRRLKGNTEVYVFEGDPVKWVYQDVQPFFVQAFAATDDGRLMEFQSHYMKDTNNGWTFLGYSFYDMKSGPPQQGFPILPINCEPKPL